MRKLGICAVLGFCWAHGAMAQHVTWSEFQPESPIADFAPGGEYPLGLTICLKGMDCPKTAVDISPWPNVDVDGDVLVCAGDECRSYAGMTAAPAPATWHLLTQAENGQVSVVGGLTQEQCEHAREDLNPVHQQCRFGYSSGCVGSDSPGDIKFSECFQ